MRKLRLIRPWHLQPQRQGAFNERFSGEVAPTVRVSNTGPAQQAPAPADKTGFRRTPAGAPATRVVHHQALRS